MSLLPPPIRLDLTAPPPGPTTAPKTNANNHTQADTQVDTPAATNSTATTATIKAAEEATAMEAGTMVTLAEEGISWTAQYP